MAEFVDTLEHRTLDKLLAELPGLASLSEMKFSLADGEVRDKIRALFSFA